MKVTATNLSPPVIGIDLRLTVLQVDAYITELVTHLVTALCAEEKYLKYSVCLCFNDRVLMTSSPLHHQPPVI